MRSLKYNMMLESINNEEGIDIYKFLGAVGTGIELKVLDKIELIRNKEYEVCLKIKEPGEKESNPIICQINMSDDIGKKIESIGLVFKAVREKFPETTEFINEQIKKHLNQDDKTLL